MAANPKRKQLREVTVKMKMLREEINRKKEEFKALRSQREKLRAELSSQSSS